MSVVAAATEVTASGAEALGDRVTSRHLCWVGTMGNGNMAGSSETTG